MNTQGGARSRWIVGSQAQKEPGLEQIRNVGTQMVTEASGVDCMTQGSCERGMGKGIRDRALEGSLVSKGRGQVQEGASERCGANPGGVMGAQESQARGQVSCADTVPASR